MRCALAASPLLFALGCVPLDNPVYLPEEVVFVETLVGDWEATDPGRQDNAQWSYWVAKGQDNAFHVRVDEDKTHYVVHLFSLGGHYFADALPVTEPNGRMLWKVSLLGDQLELYCFNPGWLSRLVAKEPNAIAHKLGNNGGVDRLTASTKDLRAFARRHVEDPQAVIKARRLKAGKDLPVADTGFGSKKHRTADYWYEVCMTCRSTRLGTDGSTRENLVEELRRITGALEVLPAVKGVDAEALECGKQALTVYQALLRHVEGCKDVSAKLIEAFHWTAPTDRLDTVLQLVDDKALQGEIKVTLDLFKHARTSLEKRYEVKLMGLQ